MNHVSWTTTVGGAESDPPFPEFSSSSDDLVSEGDESERTFVAKDEMTGSIR